MTMMDFKPHGDDLPAVCTLHFTVSQSQVGYKRAFTQRIDCAEASEGMRLLRASRKDWHPHVHLDWQKEGQILEYFVPEEADKIYREKFFYDFDGVTWLPFSVTTTGFRGEPVLFPNVEVRLEVNYQEPAVSVECVARDNKAYVNIRPGEWLHFPPIWSITCYRDLSKIDQLLKEKPQTAQDYYRCLKG